jgi:hypothetical protein
MKCRRDQEQRPRSNPGPYFFKDASLRFSRIICAAQGIASRNRFRGILDPKTPDPQAPDDWLAYAMDVPKNRLAALMNYQKNNASASPRSRS